MATVTGITSARGQAIEDESIVAGRVNGSGHLILTNHAGDASDAGPVIGPTGAIGATGATGPAGVGPSGTVIMFAGPTAPAGWLLCNGAAVSRSTYAALYTVIGTTYGVGDGSATFNLPNLNNRFARQDSVAANLGVTGGNAGHFHTMGDHTHPIDGGTQQAAAHIALASQAAPNILEERVTGLATWNANIQGDSTPIASSAVQQTTGAKVTGTTDVSGLTNTAGAANTPPPYLNLNFLIKT